MPHTISFDTHAFIKELKSAGLSEEQAEVQATALSRALSEFQSAHLDKKHELELRLKHDLTLRLDGMLVIGITLVAILVRIL